MEKRSNSLSHIDHHQQHITIDEDEFIDMEVSSINPTLLCYSFPSSPREFEFNNIVADCNAKSQQLTSPADELFYKGKLLPLHLPPRLQMVQKLLREKSEEKFNRSFTTSSTTTETTPFESCRISPATSCCVSGEIDPDEYFYECSAPLVLPESVAGVKKYSWMKKKLKLVNMNTASLGLKLKASRDYIKSMFFTKSVDHSSVEKKESFNADKLKKANKKKKKKKVSGEMLRHSKEETSEHHRRSYSGVIKSSSSSFSSSASASSSCSSSKSSSFSSSSSSKGGKQQVAVLKRSSSVGSETEASINGAIAHCKKSQQKQQTATERKSLSVDVELFSFSTPATSSMPSPESVEINLVDHVKTI